MVAVRGVVAAVLAMGLKISDAVPFPTKRLAQKQRKTAGNQPEVNGTAPKTTEDCVKSV